MTQLPTVVVQPPEEFGKITNSLFRGISGILASAQQDVQREGAVTQAQHDIALAQQRTLEIEAKVDVMRQRLANKDMEIKYRETIELERMGLIKLLADSTPEQATAILRKYRFASKENQSKVMAQHGRTLSGIDIRDAHQTIIEFFSRGDADPKQITAEGLMDAALEKRGGLPPEAKLAYQANFIGQVRSMIIGQITASANNRQAAAVKAAVRDRAGALEEYLLDAGTWDAAVEMDKTLQGFDNLPRAERDFSNAVGQAFVDVLSQFEGRYDELQALWEGLPDDIRKFLPEFRDNVGGIIRQAQAASIRRRDNAEAAQLTTDLRHLDQERTLGASFTARFLLQNANPRVASREGIRSQVRLIEAHVKDDRMLLEAGVTEESVKGARNLQKNFRAVYNAVESVPTLREIASKLGRNEALNRVAGTDWAFVAEAIVWADDDAHAMRIAKMFDNVNIRRQIGTWSKAASVIVTEAMDQGDLGAGIDLPGIPDPDLKGNYTSFLKLKRDIVLGAAEERSDPNAEGRSLEDMIEAVHEAEVNKIFRSHSSINRLAIPSKLTGIAPGGTVDDNHPFMDMLGALKATSDLRGGTDPALLQMFTHVDGFTYVPAVGSDNGGAFGKWDPEKKERGREVWAADNPLLFAALLHQLQQEYPDALRMENSDFAWNRSMPSRYIGTVDDKLFPGAQARGYWHGHLKPIFNRLYIQETGQHPPDFDHPPSEDPDAQEMDHAVFAEGSRVYNLMLGRWLPRLGYQATMFDPTIPRLITPKQTKTAQKKEPDA